MRPRLAALFVLAPLLGAANVPLAAVAPTVTADPAPVVELRLTTSTPTVLVGERLLFTAQIVNRGSADVSLVMPGDGSTDGWRTPVLRWSPAGNCRLSRCGWMNCPRTTEVFTLQPGEGKDLEWLESPRLCEPGSYEVSVEYENVPDMALKRDCDGGMVDGETAVAIESFSHTAPIKVRSNGVTVVIEAAR